MAPDDPEASWFDAALARSESAASWPLFIPLQAFLFYLSVRYSLDASYRSLIDGFLMPVHELGHPVCAAFGPFMGALGGSLFQWGLPLFVLLSFLKRGDLYAASVGLFLLGVSLSGSYQYMDSAFQMEKYPDMVFVSLGEGEVTHDWQFLFGSLGLYRGYTAVALAFRGLGLLAVWAGFLGGAALLWRMARAKLRS
jgi:hypothetical protein